MSIPTEHDWEDEEPLTEEDAVKRMIKRTARLNSPGLVGDLWNMHQNCHKEVYENGNEEHLPMTFVRYEGTGPDDPQELFYICKQCISDYIIEHPDVADKIVILRGDVTKECKEVLKKHLEEEFRQEEAKRKAKEEAFWKQTTACPICGKPMNAHSEEDKQRCLKEFVERHMDPDQNNP